MGLRLAWFLIIHVLSGACTQFTRECVCVLLELTSVITTSSLLVISRGEQYQEEEEEEEKEESITPPVDEVLAIFRVVASLFKTGRDLPPDVLAKVS